MAATKNPPNPTITNFADDVLNGIGAPITTQNRNLIYLWARAENTKANFNPLATTQPAPNATDFNSSHVKNYATYSDGVTATITTLKNGRYNGIVSDLQKGNVDPYDVVNNNASEFDTWGTTASLIASLIGKPIQKVSITQVGANLGQGAHDIKAGAENLVKDPVMLALYGLALAAGVVIMLTGFVLIGADIGIAVLGRSRVAKGGTIIVNNVVPAQRRKKEAEAAYRNRNYRTSREGISKKDSVRVVKPKTDVSRPLRKQKQTANDDIPF